MTPEIKIIQTQAKHVQILGQNFRPSDANEVLCLGLYPHRMLWRSFRAAVWSRTVFVNNEIAAIGGVGGSVLGRVGRPWMLTGPPADLVSPIRFARIFKNHVTEMLGVFPVLANYVAADYHKSVKLLSLTGFTIGEPTPIGKTNALFRKFEMMAADGH